MARPRGGPGSELAAAALNLAQNESDFEVFREADLDDVLSGIRLQLPAGETHSIPLWPDEVAAEDRIRPPFVVERWRVPEGQEMTFVAEVQDRYLETVMAHPGEIAEIAAVPYSRLRVAPNWRLRTSADDGFTGAFELNPQHQANLKALGMGVEGCCGTGMTVAILDSGFDDAVWENPDQASRRAVDDQIDLLPGVVSSAAHGTLVAAIVATAVPAAKIVPIRMAAGSESTDWDAIFSLYAARKVLADVAVLAFRQVLKEKACGQCGLVRSRAKSEVFSQALSHVTDDGDLVVTVAAGNGGTGQLACPASYPAAVPVAALRDDQPYLADFSNWDALNRRRVLALPGVAVAKDESGTLLSGTSWACAYAGGLIAARVSHSDDENPRDTATTLFTNSEPGDKHTRVPAGYVKL